jgi:hypothetical protein
MSGSSADAGLLLFAKKSAVRRILQEQDCGRVLGERGSVKSFAHLRMGNRTKESMGALHDFVTVFAIERHGVLACMEYDLRKP